MQLKISLAQKHEKERSRVLIANELAQLNQAEQDEDAGLSLCVGLRIGLLGLVGAALFWLTT